MDIIFDTIYEKSSEIFNDHTINLSRLSWCDPWTTGLICLKAIEYQNSPNKKLIPPEEEDIISYLKRLHFDRFFEELTYSAFLQQFREKPMEEKENLNVHEIMHCEFRDDFNARLTSRVRVMFRNFGMNVNDESRATALVGELGNICGKVQVS